MAHTQQANRISAATQSQPRKFWMRWRLRLGYPVAIIYWLLATPTWRSIVYGTIVALLGLIVRAAAAGYLRKDRELAVPGPYALTRNAQRRGRSAYALRYRFRRLRHPRATLLPESLRERKTTISGELGNKR